MRNLAALFFLSIAVLSLTSATLGQDKNVAKISGEYLKADVFLIRSDSGGYSLKFKHKAKGHVRQFSLSPERAKEMVANFKWAEATIPKLTPLETESRFVRFPEGQIEFRVTGVSSSGILEVLAAYPGDSDFESPFFVTIFNGSDEESLKTLKLIRAFFGQLSQIR